VSSQYASLTYNFGNISALLTYLEKNAPDQEELNFLVIPADIVLQTDSYYGTQVITQVNHYLKPSGVRLRKDLEALRFQIVSSKYNSTD
jgi:uncharacterized protein YjbK